MTEKERAVFQKALDTWGGDAQILCLLEEMAELQDALCKHKRGRRTTDDIAEEIADVEIMLNQMKLYFRVEEEVKAQRARKVSRVEERLSTNLPGKFCRFLCWKSSKYVSISCGFRLESHKIFSKIFVPLLSVQLLRN